MFSKQTCKCWVWPTPTFTRGLLLILRAGKILFFPFSVSLQRLGMGWGEKGRTSHLAPWAFLLFSLSVLSNSLWSDGLQQTRLSFTISLSLLKLASIESVMPSNHFVLCRPLLLLPPIPPSIQGLFQWVNSSREVARVLALQLQHQAFQWIFWVDFLAGDVGGEADLVWSSGPGPASLSGFSLECALQLSCRSWPAGRDS